MNLRWGTSGFTKLNWRVWVSLQARLIVKALAAVSKYVHYNYSGTKLKHRTETHETRDLVGPEYKLEHLNPNQVNYLKFKMTIKMKSGDSSTFKILDYPH